MVKVPVVGVVRNPAVAKSAVGSTRPSPTADVTAAVPLLKSSACLRKSLVSEAEPRMMGEAGEVEEESEMAPVELL